MRAIVYTFVFCLLLGAASTVQAQGRISVKRNSANLQRQTLQLNLDMNIDQVHVSSHTTLALTLALKSGNNIVYLPPVFVHGSNKFKMFERAVVLKGLDAALDGAYEVLKSDYQQNLHVPYRRSVAYKSWMNKCQLILISETLDYNNNIIDSFTQTVEKSFTVSKTGSSSKNTFSW